MLTRSKLNSIESKISEALINEVLWQLLMKKNYRKLKETIKMMNSQIKGTKKII